MAYYQRGDVYATMTLSPIEAQNGTSRTLTLPGGRQVSVLIPAGVRDGQELHFPVQGQSSPWGGPTSTLILSIAVTSTKQSLSQGQTLRKAVIDFVLGAVIFQIAVNIAASFIFPSFATLVRTSWAWIGGEFLLLVSLCFYPTRRRWTTWLRWFFTVVLTFVVPANFIALTLLQQDVPGRYFQGPSLLYQADWTYSLNGWTSPPIGASAQAWSVSQGMLVSSGQLTSFPDSRCQNNTCFSNYSTIVAPYQPRTASTQPGVYGLQDYAVEAKIHLDGEEGNSGTEHGFGLGVRRYFDGKQDEGYGWKVLDSASSISLYGQPDPQPMMSKPFSPGDGWHIYRIEVLGPHIKVMVDGILVFDEQDSRFTHGGWVELWEEADRVRVSDFTISKVQT